MCGFIKFTTLFSSTCCLSVNDKTYLPFWVKTAAYGPGILTPVTDLRGVVATQENNAQGKIKTVIINIVFS